MIELIYLIYFGIGLFDEMKFKIAPYWLTDLINFAIVERLRL